VSVLVRTTTIAIPNLFWVVIAATAHAGTSALLPQSSQLVAVARSVPTHDRTTENNTTTLACFILVDLLNLTAA